MTNSILNKLKDKRVFQNKSHINKFLKLFVTDEDEPTLSNHAFNEFKKDLNKNLKSKLVANIDFDSEKILFTFMLKDIIKKSKKIYD